MIEIELKFAVVGLPGMLRKLRSLKFKGGQRRYEKTVMYDNPGAVMQKTDGRVRLRQSGKHYELSYKKPLTREGIKKEIEHEVVVSDFGICEQILAAMNFTPVSSYERYRRTWTGRGVKITLDEFPFAVFLELEGPEEKIHKLAAKLQLDLKTNLTASCDTLFTQWRTKHHLPFQPYMRFADFAK